MFDTSKKPIAIIAANGRRQITLYFGLNLSEAKFILSDQDLLIVDQNNSYVVIKDYKTGTPPPLLRDDSGTELSAQAIEKSLTELQAAVSTPFPQAPHQDQQEHLREAFANAAYDMSAVSPSINTPKPTVVTQDISVHFGGVTTVTSDVFKFPQTINPSQCYFTVERQGNCGLLTVDNMVLQSGDTIAYHDIMQGKVIYYHDESSHEHDALILKVYDPNTENDFDLAINVAVSGEFQHAM